MANVSDRKRRQNSQIWDPVTRKEVLTFSEHTGYVYSACFSPDGKHILTGSLDKTAKDLGCVHGKGNPNP